MKKIFLISVILSVLACKDSNPQENPVYQKQEVQSASLSEYEEAKATLDELFLYAEQLKDEKISEERHASLSYPIGQKLVFQKENLNEEDRQKLKEYGLKRYEEVYPEEERKIVQLSVK